MKKELNERENGKQGIERIGWTDWAPIDENGKIIGDKPDNYPGWAECPKCGNPMPYSQQNSMDDFFECSFCNLKLFAMDISDVDRFTRNTTPACCRLCDGPYPGCRTTCKVINS